MNPERGKLLQNLLRTVFLGLFFCHTSEAVGGIFSFPPEGGLTPVFVLVQGLKVAVDFGVLWKLFGGMEISFPVSLGFLFWFLFSYLVFPRPGALSQAHIVQILGLGLFSLMLAFTVIFVNRKMGIQGEILLVCAFSASIPMFFLGLAVYLQAKSLLDFALFPMAREFMFNEAQRLDLIIPEKMGKTLKALLNVAGQDSHVSFVSKEAFFARAGELGIPLMKVSEKKFRWGSDTINLDFQDISLPKLAEILSTHFKLSLDLQSQGAARQTISLKAKNVKLEAILGQLNQIPGLKIEKQGNVLSIRDTGAPGTETVRLSFLNQNMRGQSDGGAITDRDWDMHRRFEDRQDMIGFVVLQYDYSPHFLQLSLEVPRREGEAVAGIVRFEIDYLTWFQHLLVETPAMSFNRMIPVFPVNPTSLASCFAGFSEAVPEEKIKPLPWEEAARPGSNGSNGAYWPAKSAFHELFSGGPPVTMNLGGPKGLTMRSPRGDEMLFDAWSLARARTEIAFVVPRRFIVEMLLEKHMKVVSYCVIAVFMGIILSIFYSRQLSTPIKTITNAAQKIRDGDLHAEIPAQIGHGEIQILAETLSMMASALKGKIDLANKQLSAEKSKFETLVESTWEGIFLLSPHGVTMYANHAGKQLLSEATHSGSFLEALKKLGVNFQPELPGNLDRTDEFKGAFQIPQGERAGNKIISLYIKSSWHSPEVGMQPGFIAVCRDITVEKEIDRMKNDFVSQVSHELRTPLTSIQAYTEMLLDGEAENLENQKEYLKIIYEESERLTRLINDLLDIARIESGKRVVKPVQLELCAVTRHVIQVLHAMAEQKKIEVLLTTPELSVNFLGDEDLIKQVALNLLSNGLKYTPPGGKIEISLDVSTPHRIFWNFRDNGIGLTPQDKDRLFNKFFRVDSEFVRSAGGTGLGLTLVKHIVELHQGEIKVESTYQQGSTFTVVFPCT